MWQADTALIRYLIPIIVPTAHQPASPSSDHTYAKSQARGGGKKQKATNMAITVWQGWEYLAENLGAIMFFSANMSDRWDCKIGFLSQFIYVSFRSQNLRKEVFFHISFRWSLEKVFYPLAISFWRWSMQTIVVSCTKLTNNGLVFEKAKTINDES